jgi:chromosome segregation ATPase
MGGQPSKQQEEELAKQKLEEEKARQQAILDEEERKREEEAAKAKVNRGSSRQDRRKSQLLEKQTERQPTQPRNSVDEEVDRWKVKASRAEGFDRLSPAGTVGALTAEVESLRANQAAFEKDLQAKLDAAVHDVQKAKASSQSELRDLRTKLDAQEKHLEQYASLPCHLS